MEQAFDQIQSVLKLSVISLDGSFFLTLFQVFFSSLILSGSFLINFLLSPCRTLNMERFCYSDDLK